MPRAIDFTPPVETRGRHHRKGLIIVGVILILGMVVLILVPGFQRTVKQRPSQPSSFLSRMTKPSTALGKLKDSYAGQSLDGEKEAPAVAQAPPRDTSEEERLRKENAQLRDLLSRVPKTQVKATPPPVKDNTEEKQREAERKRLEQADRKLIVRKAPEAKDGEGKIAKIHTPVSEYSLSPGWTISCLTEGQVSNETPGSFRVRTKNPAYDTATGRHVVIPQESLIVMRPRGTVLYGDSRIPVEAMTLTFPNGEWLKFGASSVQDEMGTNGLTGDIDRHYLRLFGSVILTGLLRGGNTVMAGGAGSDPAARVGAAVAQDTSSETAKQVRQFARTDPTITVPAGQGCLILLESELSLPRPYLQ